MLNVAGGVNVLNCRRRTRITIFTKNLSSAMGGGDFVPLQATEEGVGIGKSLSLQDAGEMKLK